MWWPLFIFAFMILDGGFTLQIADIHAEGYLGCGYPMRPQIELVMF
jgi:hypothetical protein